MNTIPEVMIHLQNLIHKKITQSDMARALGTGRSNISLRCKNGSELSVEEIKKIENYFEVKYFSIDIKNEGYNKIIAEEIAENQCPICSEAKAQIILRETYLIPYWEGCTNTWKREDFKVFAFDKEIVDNDWKRKPESLRVIAMAGDKMDGLPIPLRNRNILVVDISVTDYEKTGVYLFTTHGGENIYVARLNQIYNGNVQFIYNNEIYPPVTHTLEELNKVDFKVIGRILHNVTLTI